MTNPTIKDFWMVADDGEAKQRGASSSTCGRSAVAVLEKRLSERRQSCGPVSPARRS
jgi:hypothetical protein